MGMTKMGQAAIFETRGNADCHVILRGGRKPNYQAATSRRLRALADRGLREQVMIDFSHANSEKQHMRQIAVGQDVGAQIAAGDRRITGVMIESHLADGRQDLKPGVRRRGGVSITDACLGWADTEPLLVNLSKAVAHSGAPWPAREGKVVSSVRRPRARLRARGRCNYVGFWARCLASLHRHESWSPASIAHYAGPFASYLRALERLGPRASTCRNLFEEDIR
jgi:3-deoxy-7-phosphoheptulonate synthase